MQLRSQSEVVYFCITYECCVYNIMFYVACMHVIRIYVCMRYVHVCMYVCIYVCMYVYRLRSDAAATILLLFVLVRLQIEDGYYSRAAFA